MYSVFNMMYLVVAAITAFTLSNVQCECDHNTKRYYSELNCKPVFTEDPKCPSSYDCSEALARKAGKCYFLGKEYDVNSTIAKADFKNPCLVDCRCRKQYDGSTSFTCVNAECPELFDPRLKPGCFRQHSHDQCCAIKTNCQPNKDDGTPFFTCQYGGEVFKEGAKFYPKEEPCKQCICSAGFNGTLSEPWCQQINCGLDLYYGSNIASGCVPTFYGDDGCCPIEWRCPNPNDKVVPRPIESSKPSAKLNEDKCKFGKLELNIGDTISPEHGNEDTECKCIAPPHPICVKKAD